MLVKNDDQQEEFSADQKLKDENRVFKRTGGRSQENSFLHFIPAFFDQKTEQVFLSRFSSGKLAPIHLLEGLPEGCVEQRDSAGFVTKIKASIISGFVKGEQFFTRAQVADIMQFC